MAFGGAASVCPSAGRSLSDVGRRWLDRVDRDALPLGAGEISMSSDVRVLRCIGDCTSSPQFSHLTTSSVGESQYFPLLNNNDTDKKDTVFQENKTVVIDQSAIIIQCYVTCHK